jgi:hypothetical protein
VAQDKEAVARGQGLERRQEAGGAGVDADAGPRRRRDLDDVSAGDPAGRVAGIEPVGDAEEEGRGRTRRGPRRGGDGEAAAGEGRVEDVAAPRSRGGGRPGGVAAAAPWTTWPVFRCAREYEARNTEVS